MASFVTKRKRRSNVAVGRVGRCIRPLMCAAVVGCGLTGCATPQSDRAVREPGAVEVVQRPRDPEPRSPFIAKGTRVTTALVPLGAIAYDDFTLPLLHPSGRFAATQVGVAPTWPTALAATGSTVPDGSAVRIVTLTPGEPPRVVAELPAPLLLGRSANEHGFVVEQPRADGSRRLGFCDWSGAAIEWFADDGLVNAHASMSPSGAMAWSRRAVSDEHFELVLLDQSGEHSLSSVDGESWLLPEFSADGELLFCLRLRDGVLQIAALLPSTDAIMRQSLRTLTITSRGTPSVAFQTMSPQTGARPGAGQPVGTLLFFHPGDGRMALWSPREGRVRSLRQGSIAALIFDPERALVSLGRTLALQRLDDGTTTPDLLSGVAVPRSVNDQPWPVIILQPGDGMVSLLGLRLVTVEEGVVGSGG